jgi:WhiA C-terminal HTH domain
MPEPHAAALTPAQAAALYATPLTVREIADKTGVSAVTVLHRLEAAGVPRRHAAGGEQFIHGIVHNTGPLKAGNRSRARAAAARDVRIARRALEMEDDWPVLWRRTAKARVACPDATWAELADLLSMTKDQAIGYFRRLRDKMATIGVTG